jgi:hypothetical protein
MSSQIVLHYYLDLFETSANTLTDISFDNLSFLQEQEPVYNELGQKESKSYFDLNGREAVKIEYSRVFGDHVFNGETFENVFLGLQKIVHFFDWAGEIAYTKKKQAYLFKLEPEYTGEIVTGFTSRKMRDILRIDQRNTAL